MLTELLDLGPDITRLVLLILQIIEKCREEQQEESAQRIANVQENANDQTKLVDQILAAGPNLDAVNKLHDLLGMLRQRQSELGQTAGDAGPDLGPDSPG